jgi:tetratricopeptide (TPR) repeat protein
MRLGKTEEALHDFDYLHVVEPYNSEFISDRAVVLHLLGKNQEALEEFDRAANLEPNNPYRYSSRAYFKDRIRDYEGAIEDYQKAIDLDPEDAISLNNLGLVEEKLGRKEQAQSRFNKADELVGYTPKKRPSSPLERGKNDIENTLENPKVAMAEKKVSLDFYLQTLRSIFFDATSRKGFFTFLSSFFGLSKVKKS